MTDHQDSQCSRCGVAITQPEARLTVEGEALADSPPALALCPRCTRSFARWLKARRRTARDEATSAARTQNVTHVLRKHHKPKNRMEKLRREALWHDLLAFGLVTALAVLMWVVWWHL